MRHAVEAAQLLGRNDAQVSVSQPLDRGAKRILLFNPAVYDTRFAWARWTQSLGLLRLASFFRTEGVDLRFLDAVTCHRKERLRRKRAEILDLDGFKVNRWRFGSTRWALRAELRALAKAKW